MDMFIKVDTKTPFKIKQIPIAKIGISKINFVGYVECFGDRMRESARSGDDMMAEKAFRRARRLRQVKAYDKDDRVIEIDHQSFDVMPRQLFVKVNNALDEFDTKRGKVLTENGDGVTTPIVYQLGTPIEFVDTKANEKPIGTEQKIVELEFVAKTGGDIEEVLCCGNSLQQALALIRTCATPLGGGTSLMRLPSFMIDEISTADGFAIMASVLPVFTE
jgi:hypothetical protein